MSYILIVVALIGVLVFGAAVSRFGYSKGVLESQIVDTVKDAAKNTVATSTTVESSSESGFTLDLSNQGLTKVPGDVFSRTELVSLDISNNKLLGALQAEVRLLSNLRMLDMSDNQFTGVPAEVGQLSSLEILDLSNNKLTGLPHELGNLSNLKILDLRGNAYAPQDLEIIRSTLPKSVVVKVD